MRQDRLRIYMAALEAAQIDSSFVMASSFRSGSSYIAALLMKNGQCNATRELFSKFREATADGPRANAAFPDQVEKVFSYVEDGRLTTKIMWPHRNYLAKALGLERAASAMFADLFPNAKWVHITRRNKFKQAVSFWRAKQSGRWHVFKDEEEPELEFDFDAIRKCYVELSMHDAMWEDFFEVSGIEPYSVVYEDFMAAQEEQASDLITYLSGARPESVNLNVGQRKQSDGLSEVFVARFMEQAYKTGF